jgi:hypothetical protein
VPADSVVGVARLVVPGAGLPVVWVHRGEPWMLVAVLASYALACWASRFALLDRYDPWRPVRTSVLVNGRWVMPPPERRTRLVPWLARLPRFLPLTRVPGQGVKGAT